jgi:hypothetical protein
VGVCFICTLTPYNDFVVNNTYFTGNFLPVGVVLFLLVFVICVNAPLSRFWPRFAFSPGEMAVIFGMTLVSCALPSSGCMRFVPSQLVGIWYQAGISADYRDLLEKLNLPDWIFPKFTATSAAGRANDPVVQFFWSRAPVEQDTFFNHWRAVPWSAWLRPALAWAVLMSGAYGMMICVAVFVRRQWVENERLPFPLATLYVALLEPPEPGRAFNRLFRSRAFWWTFLGVFALHGINALHVYYPARFPQLPLDFNFNGMMVDPPWKYIDWFVKLGRVQFCIVGIAYFVQSKVLFSIWFCMMLWQIPKIAYGYAAADFPWMGIRDQLLGGLLPYAISILWIGRGQWLLIGRQMFRGPPASGSREPTGRYLPYGPAGWAFLGCIGITMAWLMLAGCSFIGALLIVLMYLLVMTLLMRIVAETGLIFVHFLMPLWRPWSYFVDLFPSTVTLSRMRSFFYSTMMESVLGVAQREAFSVYASTSLRVADHLEYAEERNWRRGIPLVGALLLALIVGYVVSGTSMLYCEYTYSSTIDRSQSAPINGYAMDPAIHATLDPVRDYSRTGHGAPEPHSRLRHFLLGAGITSVLTFLNLRYAGWPIHPLGYLLLFSWTMWLCWFSIFLGWLAKVLILRFGGIHMFRRAQPIFVGLIVGEIGAATFWLVVSLIRVQMGMEYRAINLLPM